MIPKIIHYCWFGGNPFPESALKCIASWKKYCPDYEIREWNESNFDVSCCDYVREAYEAKKWAFVSDYARFRILYENGGLYFDTDVEMIKPIDDIVSKGSFMGIERKNSMDVAPGLGMGAEPGLEIYKEFLEAYHNRHFLNDDGSSNLTTIVSYTTQILSAHGLRKKREIQCVSDICIYPKEYFCPVDYMTGELDITENTRTIHHYSATWHGETEKYASKIRLKLVRFMPAKIASALSNVISRIKCEGVGSCFRWILHHK